MKIIFSIENIISKYKNSIIYFHIEIINHEKIVIYSNIFQIALTRICL